MLKAIAKKGRMLKVGIIGCGKIADSHVAQIQRIQGCEIVGVCDTEELMAKQLYERFPIKGYYTDIYTFFKSAQPDVVHITTPPQSHLAIGLKSLEYGAHILVEKPFTINTDEARILINAANEADRKVTVGHDAQFSAVSRRMRKLVKEGYLGDAPVHLDSYWCYDLSDATYAKALLADTQHWTRKLPGGLPHNIINHGVSKVAEFLHSESPHVIAHGFVSPFLQKLGETKIIDELRVIIHDEKGTTAYFTFSSQMRPSLHQFAIYGHKNGIMIDEGKRILLKLSGYEFKSYTEHFIQPVIYAKQYLGNLAYNLRSFLKMQFHFDDDKMQLFKSFYQSITDGTPLPIPYREILLTSLIMDRIFEQVNRNQQGNPSR
ncbi:MAG: Gfo/Idh/MocA family oxidoreductase [Candidatus Thermoplasmatota archaeon]|nr:Gfo/Idh/MocA family oxidoreductase [Candidatus Thermoplasmatota archaeon]